MHIANLYRKLKRILYDTNVALVNKGLNEVSTLYDVFDEIQKLGTINKLPYLLSKAIVEVSAEDLSSATEIGDNIFENNSNLQVITIPSNITSISERAFAGCVNLKHIYLQSTQPPRLGMYGRPPWYANFTIHVPVGSGDAYKSATNWSSFADKIVEYAAE